jgi:pimeloyl-ACP methyl ester carboxylesterase
MKKILWTAIVILAAAAAGFWARPVSYFNQSLYILDGLTGVSSRTIMIGNHRVHYEVEGPQNGPVVVLVHGLGSRAEDWRRLTPYLRDAGFRVYLPDLLGYGRSDKPADFSYSVHDEANLVADFMNALELRQVDLGGWSMGGAIVQHVAADHPERIRRLMLFDSAGLFVLPTWDMKLFTPTTRADLDRLNVLLIPNPPTIPGFIARDILRVSNERAWVIHRALDSMITGQDATDKLVGQLKMPVLILWGAEDRIVSTAQAESLHKLIPQSELEIFPGCGHLAPEFCAAQMGPRAVAFLRK